MSKLWALSKVLFKTNFGIGIGNSRNKKNNKWLNIFLVGLLVVFVMAALGVPIILAIDGILEIAPLENILLSLILPLAGVTTVVFAVFSVVSVFYLSKDSDYLLPLPLTPKDIMLSKFFVSLMNQYYILFMFILPCLVGVGVGINAGVLYYVYTSIIFVLLPIIPSVVVALIILLITKFTGVLKNKDLFMYISMGIVLVFALGYNFVVQEFIAIDPNSIGSTFGELENNVIPYFEKIFPFYNSASNALMNFDNLNGIFSLIAFITFNLLSLLVLYFVGDKWYLKTLIVNRGNKKKLEDVEKTVKLSKKSAFKVLLEKEWLIVKRTPIFMLNIVIIIFLMPVILAMSFAIGYTGAMGESLTLPSASVISTYLDNPIVYMIVMIIGVFFTSFSLAGSTAVSREGRDAWFMKTIPISAFKQINVKVFFAALLDFIGVLLVVVIPIVLFKIPLYYVLCVMVPLVIIIFMLNYFNIYLDLKNPKLNWSEESVAVKQNINSLFSVLITLAVSCLFGIVAYLLYRYKIKVNVIVLSGIVSIVCGMILALIIYLFKRNDSKLLDNVD